MKKLVIGVIASSYLLSLPTFAIQPKANKVTPKEENVWISIGNDAVELINKSSNLTFSIDDIQPVQAIRGVEPLSNSKGVLDKINVARISKSQLNQLSEFMHENFKRCGGFVFHNSFADAVKYTTNAANIDNEIQVTYTIDNPQGVNSLLYELSAANLSGTVNTLTNYYNRYYTTSTGKEAAIAIRDNWANIASTRSDINVELYDHSWQQSSVIATITGTTNPDEIVIVGGHLDSINQSNPTNGRAPGADDNASGIAVITESLRAIVASDFKPKRTIKFMGYAAEEVGLRGSGEIAQAYKSQGLNVIGVAQFDMSGYKGTSNKDIVFMTDYTNSAQNTFMTQLIDTYLSDINYGFDQCGYGCSDHASWHNRGFAASMPFESNMSQYNRSIHTSGDTDFNSAHSFNFARLSVTFLAELAKSGDVIVPPDEEVLENNVPVTVSGASKEQSFFSLAVPDTATTLKFNTSGGTGDADLYVKFGQKPSLQDYDCKSTSSSSTEECIISTISTGKYYVMVEAWNVITNVSLVGSYSESGGTNPVPIDRTENNVSVGSRDWTRFTEQLEEGYTSLVVSIEGGTGDADLYVTHNSPSSTSNWQCRPYKNGNNETCTFNNPDAGTWHIDIRGYRPASGVTLKIKAN